VHDLLPSRPSALLGAGALSVWLLAFVAGSCAGAASFAIRHVTIIDVAQGRPLPDHTVVVSGRRIAQVGPSNRVRVPAGARVIDGRGRYLIPGLWDMHTHVWNDSATFATAPSLLVAHGVTGVRDMAGRLPDVLAWRTATREGRLLGPRAVVSGPLIDGRPPATEGDITVATPDEGRRAVDSLAAAGVDFIKAYEMLRRDTYVAIVDQARRRGVPVAGHLPLAVDAFEASGLGVASFEHLRNLELACSARADSLRAARTAMLDSSLDKPGRALRGQILSAQRTVALDTGDRARCDSLLRTLARNGTWQVPTLFLDLVPLALADSGAMRRVRAAEPYVSKAMADWWREQQDRFLAAPMSAREPAQRHARWLRDFVPRLRDAGVGLLAGTDMPNLLTAPGFSLHEELRALRDAGLTNLEALQAATIAPARFLGATDSLGTVAEEKVADLVLLDADPLEDIANTTRIHAVIVAGRLLDRKALDGLLAEVRRRAAGAAK
jgi:imidazolonepropionase-like amidohydrolase